MSETTSRRGRRLRRSPEASKRLERARERNAAQLAEQREREQRVLDALAEFVEAGDSIAAANVALESKIVELERKINSLRDSAHEQVAAEHERQARAALTIHEAGRNAAQVADLLELRSEKYARQLIATARGGIDEPRQEPAGVRGRGTHEASSGEQGQSSDVGQQGGSAGAAGLGAGRAQSAP